MEQVVDFLQEFVFNLMVALAPIVMGFILAWVKAQIDLAIQRLEDNKPKLAAAMRQAVSLAVQAAEQAGLAGLIEDKKQYAFNIAQVWLDEHGWDEFDIDLLEAAIEAEVNKQFPHEGAGAAVERDWASEW